MDHGVLGGWNTAVAILVYYQIQRDPRAVGPHLIPGSGARDDSVEVFRILLRGGKALTAALGASVVVGELRGVAVMGVDDRLCLHCHFVNGSVSQINHLFRMAKREVGIAADVSGIRAGAGITGADRRSNRGVGNRPGPPAVPDGLKLSIP